MCSCAFSCFTCVCRLYSPPSLPQDAGRPTHVLLAKLGELYLKGGHGLAKDPSAAGDYFSQAGDAALAAMKGKMATKYYMQAEEAWAECD